ncbi:formylglycine-generating enzyme family protein [Planctomycetota bacterium]
MRMVWLLCAALFFLAGCGQKRVFENTIGIKMVRIQPGEFQMGSVAGDLDEKPVHLVKLTKPFYLGVTEVTQAQWDAVMDSNPSQVKSENLPVDNVMWESCREFCIRLTELEQESGEISMGARYRLPTEAEWEYACRAGAKARFCFGNSLDKLGDYAWYCENSSRRMHEVGTKKPNNWGLYDMHGNAWEWCQDWHQNQYPAKKAIDPTGPDYGNERVIRGGCCWGDFRICRSSNRDWSYAGYEYSQGIGFRVVLDNESPHRRANQN